MDQWLALGNAVGRSYSIQQHDLLLILDLEETCIKHGAINPVEVIELSAVAVDSATGNIVSELHMFVKPDINPMLSKYCVEATGITQEMIDNDGKTWEETCQVVHEWLDSMKCISGEVSYAWLTMGDHDLGTLVPNQCELAEVSLPFFWCNWINFKKVFAEAYSMGGNPSIVTMLKTLELPLQGLQHSGIGACRNVANVLKRTIWDGKKVEITSGFL